MPPTPLSMDSDPHVFREGAALEKKQKTKTLGNQFINCN